MLVQQTKMGALFLNGVAQTNPKNPKSNGDIPRYDGTAAITIADAPEDATDSIITWNVVPDMARWSQCGQLLIADRVLLTDVSWDALAAAGFDEGVNVIINGQKYRCHLLPAMVRRHDDPSAWDEALYNTTADNDVWHWQDMFFWGYGRNPNQYGRIQECEKECVYRGGDPRIDENHWMSPSCHQVNIGFRPALEPLIAATLSVRGFRFQAPQSHIRSFLVDTPIGKLKVHAKNVVDTAGNFPGVYVDLVREGQDDQLLACVEWESVDKQLQACVYGNKDEDSPTLIETYQF